MCGRFVKLTSGDDVEQLVEVKYPPQTRARNDLVQRMEVFFEEMKSEDIK